MNLALLLLLALPSLRQASAPPSEAARIDELVQKQMATRGAVGLSVAVARGDELLYSKASGFADLEFQVHADTDTMFRIGSVTKQFTSAAILVLSERNKLSLDDPLTKFLPDYPTHGHEITLRHLLTHTSGVPNYTALGPKWERGRSLELTDDELVALFKDVPLDFAPGESWRYSNSGYYLLGMVVAKVSGRPYADFLRETFFEPLHLERTRYDSNAEVMTDRAQGYTFDGKNFLNDQPLGMSQPGAAGGLISTASDLVRWQQALVGGRVVKPESYEEMTVPYILDSGRETTYGMGLQLDEQVGHRCVWHGGGIDGFNSVLLYFPEEKLHIAAISNSEVLSAAAVGLSIAKALLDGK